MRIVAVDVETGGLCPDTSALLSIGVASYRVDEFERPPVVEVCHVMPAPGLVIETDAMRINGWRGVPVGARDERDAFHWLYRRLFGARALLAHNLSFDLAVLQAMSRRVGDVLLLPSDRRCTLRKAQGERKAGILPAGASCRLADLCAFLGIDHQTGERGEHLAHLDALACLELGSVLWYDELMACRSQRGGI